MTDPDSDRGGGSAVGRAARSLSEDSFLETKPATQ